MPTGQTPPPRDENNETHSERARRLKAGGYANNTYPYNDPFLDQEDDGDN